MGSGERAERGTAGRDPDLAWRRRRRLGIGFCAFSGLQLVALVLAAGDWARFGLYVLLAAAIVAAYAAAGVHLLRPSARAFWIPLLLSFLALVAFPVGTAIGAYGVWALLSARSPVRRPVHV